MKAIDTEYKGYLFRSRLEARWAVFFDTCGVDWEYEPEGYDLGNGVYYLLDFLLHGVDGRDGGDLYVEVKGEMTPGDAKKIQRFSTAGGRDPETGKYRNAILVVGNIPDGVTANEIASYISGHAYASAAVSLFNFEAVDGDCFAAHPGINRFGRFELFGDDGSYLCGQDDAATADAYRRARQARFEHGERPCIRR